MKRNVTTNSQRDTGFSLVEVLAAITIIGVIIFLAIPNIVQIRQDAEENLAKSRADALNIAVAAYFQATGPEQAQGWWTSNSATSERYTRVSPYLAFAPAALSSYMPKNYALAFSNTDPHRYKAALIFSNSFTNRSISY
jgi:prepilin-type N-terminal cleavage/methylation domain-containing protein